MIKTEMNKEYKKSNGVHYTPTDVSKYIASQITNIYNKKKAGTIKVLDPACGDGELLLAIIDLLIEKSISFEIIGIDLNNDELIVAKERIEKKLKNNYHSTFVNADFTKYYKDYKDIDIIIANPPYVRTQTMGDGKAKEYSESFEVSGRFDLYQVFLVAITQALKTDGVIGIITSNKYLFNKAGEKTRNFLLSNYYINKIVDLGDTKVFEASVLPAIFFGVKSSFKNSNPKYIKIYENSTEQESSNINRSSLYDLLNTGEIGNYKVDNKVFVVEKGSVINTYQSKDPWILATDEDYNWYKTIVEKSNKCISDIAKVKVGIKTTADSVFIKDTWDNIKDICPEENLIKDLISSKTVNKWYISNKTNLKKILYPYFTIDGKKTVIELTNYPNAGKYFESKKEILTSRKYFEKSNKKWYEIWVSHNPEDWRKPKIVFPDISSTPKFLLDSNNLLVDGNCYWILLNEKINKDYLYLIMGICNSQFMEKFHDIAFQNKLYSGKRRYVSQYVEKYPIPELDNPCSIEIINCVKAIMNSGNTKNIKEYENRIDELLNKIYFDYQEVY